MATLSYQQSKATGTALTFTAAAGGGDDIKPSERGIILIRNSDASATTVTVVTPGNDKYGQARPDLTLSVAAGATASFGPFPTDLANPADGRVDLTYSKVTALTVAAFTV